jgi:hypothetical protein
MTNPAAGTDLTGWTSSTCSPSRVTGLTGLPVTTGIQSGGSGFFRTPVVPCSPGDQFTVSFWSKNGTGVFQFPHTIYISYTTSGHGEQFPETFSSTNVDIGAVARSSRVADVTKVPADATGIFLIMDSYPAGMIHTAVLFEKTASVDTYFDGSFPDSAWDGTTDLSASTRVYTLETMDWVALGLTPPTLTDAQDGTQDYNMGLQFSLTAPGYCYGVEWNPTPNSNTPVPTGGCIAQLWNADTSTLLESVAFTATPGSVQQRIYFNKQPALTTGVNYIVTVYTIRYVFRAMTSWTGLVSASGKIHADKGRLFIGAGAGPGFPNQSQDSLYYVAPLMSLGATPAAPTVSVWNGSAEVPAMISVWNGSAEVPAVVDSITP